MLYLLLIYGRFFQVDGCQFMLQVRSHDEENVLVVDMFDTTRKDNDESTDVLLNDVSLAFNAGMRKGSLSEFTCSQ